MAKKSPYVLYSGAERKPDRAPYGKHEFHSIADQERAEGKAFSKGRSKRKKKKSQKTKNR